MPSDINSLETCQCMRIFSVLKQVWPRRSVNSVCALRNRARVRFQGKCPKPMLRQCIVIYLFGRFNLFQILPGIKKEGPLLTLLYFIEMAFNHKDMIKYIHHRKDFYNMHQRTRLYNPGRNFLRLLSRYKIDIGICNMLY